MKHFVSLCVLLLLIQFSTQTPKFENCPEDIMKAPQCECCKLMCSSEGTSVTAKACPLSHCRPGTQIGYEEDKTKEYPDCCGRPICKS